MSRSSRRIVVATLADRWSMAMAVGLKQNGHDIALLNVHRHQKVSGIIQELKSLEPFDFLILRNFHFLAIDGDITEAYDYLFTACPYKIVVWYHDSQAFQDEARIQAAWRRHRKLPQSVIFSIDRGDIAPLEASGNRAFHLPICADGQVLDHQNNPLWKSRCSTFSFDASFAGNQIFRDPPFPASPENFKEAFEEKLIEHVEDVLRYHSSWPVMKESIHSLFDHKFKNADEFCKYLDCATAEIPAVEQRFWTEIFPEINSWYSWYRLSLRLNEIRKHCDLRVFGADQWKDFLVHYPHETPSLSECDLHALFASSKISICYTKFHFKTGIHERPFLISASGGFALTENQADLRLVFDENEMVSYSCEEELFDKIRYYLSHETERRAMAERACRRTRSQHLYKHRMAEMLQILEREDFI